MKIPILILLTLLLNFKSFGHFILMGEKPVIVPFQLVNNLIVLTAEVNGTPMKFVLDSGVAETLLFSSSNQQLDLKQTQKMEFRGLGSAQSVEGVMSKNNQISFTKGYVDTHHTIYVIFDESFNISANVGMPINGIIGYNFFKNAIVQIDYVSCKLTLYSSMQQVKKSKLRSYRQQPLVIENSKPYILAEPFTSSRNYPNSKLLLDLGNTDALWLFGHKLKYFEVKSKSISEQIGRGFSGDIFGKRTRIPGFKLSDFHLENVVIAIPDSHSIHNVVLSKNRVGSIGSEIISRFDIIVNYAEGFVCLRPNRYFSKPFRLNMSGIEVIHDGAELIEDVVLQIDERNGVQTKLSSLKRNPGFDAELPAANKSVRYQFKPIYIAHRVKSGSPAALAGVLQGDRILKIKGLQTENLSIAQIQNMLNDDEGVHVWLTIERDNQIKKVSFYLRDPLN